MELRSSRSRSRTPFLQTNIEKEVLEGENHVGHVVKTTRSTVVKTYENITTEGSTESTQILKPVRMKTRSQKTRIKTSDYSSEDGEGEVSSSAHQLDNTRNRIREEILRSTNGKLDVAPSKIYKEAVEYWNKYPKTDYTYSRHSKDRVELAPGLVIMPNMSRRSLHNYQGSENFRSNKQTNTESYEDEVEEDYLATHSENHLTRRRPRTLFTDNNYGENHEYMISRTSSYRKSIVSRFLSVFVSIFTAIAYPFYYVYGKQQSVILWFGKKLHKIVSKVMLLDTWLLRRSHSENKVPVILALCLLPLIFFGGWWLLYGLSQILYGMFFNTTSLILPTIPRINMDRLYNTFFTEDSNEVDHRDLNHLNLELGHLESKAEERIIRATGRQSLSAGEIAAGLSEEQLKAIARSIQNSINLQSNFDTDIIIEKVLESPSIQNVINNYNVNLMKSGAGREESIKVNEEIVNHQKVIINNLKDEINKIRTELLQLEKSRNDDISKIVTQLRTENANSNAHILVEVNKCCRRSFIQIESYVTRILRDLLGAPSYVANQQDMSKWLHSVFVAKQDLEARLANLTRNLKFEFNHLIENNGKRVMDDVAAKISHELRGRLNDVERSGVAVNVDSLTDDYIRTIVGDTLAIYDADKTGLVDYALEPAGGQVVSTRCTESYQARTAVISLLNIPLWYPTNTPRTVITPGVNPGECWAFQNFPGFLLLKLSGTITVEAFTLEHISKKLIPNGKIDSAPKNFEVYGLDDETDKKPILLGKYVYDSSGPPLQYFPVQRQGLVYNHVELRILSNHGNPNYTCLYRFRVHGTLSVEPT